MVLQFMTQKWSDSNLNPQKTFARDIPYICVYCFMGSNFKKKKIIFNTDNEAIVNVQLKKRPNHLR